MKKLLRKPKKSVTSNMVMAYWGEDSGALIICGYNF